MAVGSRITRVAAGLVLVAIVAAVAVWRIQGSGRPADATSQPVLRVPALPRLGTIQTVDQNDVGDPFIVSIPPNVAPPKLYRLLVSGHSGSSSSSPPRGWFVLVGTTDWQSNVPTAVSDNLTQWTQVPDSLPVLPKWAAPTVSMTWGPAVQHTRSGWVLYYSTEDQESGLECIGRAISRSPIGPYQDLTAAPMLCQRDLGGSIDPSVIKGAGGATYLLWKNNGNAVHIPDSIWSEELSGDGLSLLGKPHRLVGVDAPWERGIVEAPAMVAASAGGDWLFYSGGNWSRPNGYATGLAYCATPIGPCQETSSKPFLATSSEAISPGGLDTFTDQTGRLWAAFTSLVAVPSTWHPGHTYYNRVLDIAPFLAH